MTAIETETFARLLRRYRLAASFSQEQLGERAQLSTNAIAALERGRRSAPRPGTVVRLAEALSLDPAERAMLIAAVSGARSDWPSQPVGRSRRLPAPLTSFVGREGELAEVGRLLASTRLLTLTGAGGAGKTRLALTAATAFADTHVDGAGLVELAALTDPSMVPHALAALLGVPEQPGRQMVDVLAEALQSRDLLIVLDNCEHVIGACAGLTDMLLRGCPKLQILTTSREPLDIAGEVVWRVPSLSVPERTGAASPEETAQHDAVRLFVDRAHSVMPGFSLDGQNAPSVAEICRRLDGMPLAIELAAARVRVLAPGQILERLNNRFSLLVGGGRMAPPRQQTLRATIDWSYELLSDLERLVFERLSVFAGSWTLEACQAVCAFGTLEALEATTLLDLLTQLIDKSLVLVQLSSAGEARYRLLETLRAYALERLEERGETTVTRGKHATFFLDLAERATVDLRGLAQSAALMRLQHEQDNLRAALAWSIQAGDAETGLRLAAALADFWQRRGYVAEGRGWLARTLESGGMAPMGLRAAALWGAGDLARSRRDGPTAIAFYTECLALGQAAGDQLAIAHALRGLGSSTLTEPFELAEAMLTESLAIFRTLSVSWGCAWCLYSLGNLAVLRGDPARAEVLFGESLAISQSYGPPSRSAFDLQALGHLAWASGDLGRAQALLEQALRLSVELEDLRGIAICLESLALVAEAKMQPERALHLFAAAAVIRAAIGVGPRGPSREWQAPDYQRGLAAARATLGDAKSRAAWAVGRSLSLEEAVGEALTAELIRGTSAGTDRAAS